MPSRVRRLLHDVLDRQRRMSRRVDRLLPEDYRIDPLESFEADIIPRYLFPGARLYDVGGGKHPAVGSQEKARLGLHVTALDISTDELARAPFGAYDDAVVADITQFRGEGDGDIVISNSVLEHVSDVDAALEAISSILRPGGVAVLYVPCRNAAFARLNMFVPGGAKRVLLELALGQHVLSHCGFQAYYDRCTPADFRRLGPRHGLQVEEMRPYFSSHYFEFVTPVHILWRLLQVGFRAIAGEQASEGFAVIFRKTAA